MNSRIQGNEKIMHVRAIANANAESHAVPQTGFSNIVKFHRETQEKPENLQTSLVSFGLELNMISMFPSASHKRLSRAAGQRREGQR